MNCDICRRAYEIGEATITKAYENSPSLIESKLLELAQQMADRDCTLCPVYLRMMAEDQIE